jgi:hypothetical protein
MPIINKKYLFIVVLIGAITVSGYSQKRYKSSEVGVFGGISYYTGELNPDGHFNPALIHPAFGGIFRRTLNARYALKLSGIYGKLSGSDALFNNTYQNARALSFSSTLIEASGQIEFNYYPFVANDNDFYHTPYVFVGLSCFYFSPKTVIDGTKIDVLSQNYEDGTSKTIKFQPSIPFGIGYKLKLNHRFILAAEWGLRKTFTDYIDGVSKVYSTGYQRGNSQNNDWYSIAGLMLTMRLGGRPNSCWNQ